VVVAVAVAVVAPKLLAVGNAAVTFAAIAD
jgi:hypothetical protein